MKIGGFLYIICSLGAILVIYLVYLIFKMATLFYYIFLLVLPVKTTLWSVCVCSVECVGWILERSGGVCSVVSI